ncbi:MAG: glycosyltransferase [Prevotella sp.]|nr:glycosyltransferase [Prevotella sp.]
MSVYKSEKGEYLDRSLRSVWDDQTRKPEQIFLVEDGPLTEGLYAVIDKWKERLGDKLVVCQNEQNLGLTKSLNNGIELITSDLIARSYSDDITAQQRF